MPMRRLGRFLVTMLAIIGGLVLLAGGLGLYVASKQGDEPLPERMALRIEFEKGVIEAAPDNPLASFDMDGAYVLQDLVAAIDKAAIDDRVNALYGVIGSSGLKLARAQEIRDAVLRFRTTGKPTIMFAETIGESGNGTIDYFLASAFERIWLQPSGDLSITGFMAESPFFKQTLDKLDITTEFGARHEYKSAIEMFTQSSYSAAARESLKGILDAWSGQIIESVASERRMTREQVKALIDGAPLFASEALEGGLVDRLGYRHEAEADALREDADFIGPEQYLAAAPKPAHNTAKIALIHAVGAIQRGHADSSPLGEGGVGSDKRVSAIDRAIDDPSIRAIVLRIDSPGGSYVASDTIWRAVRRAREEGKPVIASMGEVAASGGYFIAMAADQIVAQPGTITGSIGVFSGKVVLGEFWKKLGVTWDRVQVGGNAGMWSSVQPFSPEAWNRMNVMLDRIYDDFSGKAAEARGLSSQAIDQVARGRIWSGADAKRLKLVDALGGVNVAFDLARQAAGIGQEVPVELIAFPPPKSLEDYVREILTTGHLPAGMGAKLTQSAWLETLAPLKPLLEVMATAPRRGSELRAPILP